MSENIIVNSGDRLSHRIMEKSCPVCEHVGIVLNASDKMLKESDSMLFKKLLSSISCSVCRVEICCKIYSTFRTELALIYKKLSSCDTIKNKSSCFCFLLLLKIVHDLSSHAVKEVKERSFILESNLKLLNIFCMLEVISSRTEEVLFYRNRRILLPHGARAGSIIKARAQVSICLGIESAGSLSKLRIERDLSCSVIKCVRFSVDKLKLAFIGPCSYDSS